MPLLVPNGLRAAGKRVFYETLRWSGLTRCAEALRAGRFPILAYHGLTRRPRPDDRLYNDSKFLPAEDFARQIAAICSAWRILSLSELVSRIEAGRSLPSRTLAVTFDDGYESVYTDAYPVLKRHGCPATVFLATDFVLRRTPFWEDRLREAFVASAAGALEGVRLDGPVRRSALYAKSRDRLRRLPERLRAVELERLHGLLSPRGDPPRDPDSEPLTPRQVREMALSGLVEFGSHSVNHCDLTLLEEDAAAAELAGSARQVESVVGQPPRHFAFPYGRWSARRLATARRAGYRSACVAGYVLNRAPVDAFPLYRLALGAGDCDAAVAATLAGLRVTLGPLGGGRVE